MSFFFDSLFSGGLVGRGHYLPNAALTACVTDSELQICMESCLDNCQLSLSLIAIKDEGSFFSISPWLSARRLPPECGGMASWPPSQQIVIDGSSLSDSQYDVFWMLDFLEFVLEEAPTIKKKTL